MNKKLLLKSLVIWLGVVAVTCIGVAAIPEIPEWIGTSVGVISGGIGAILGTSYYLKNDKQL